MIISDENAIEVFLNIYPTVTGANAALILNTLMPIQTNWINYRAEVCAVIMLKVADAQRQTIGVDDAIKSLENSITEFSSKYKYHYLMKSDMYHNLGVYLAQAGRTDEARAVFNKHVYYHLIDNVTYRDYDFFSFRSCSDFSIENLRNNTLSVASPTRFNDPMDCLIFPWMQLQIQNLTNGSDIVGANLLKEAYSHIKIRCFVRNKPLPREVDNPTARTVVPEQYNLLMWTHYTDCHKGFCVKYCFPAELVCNHNDVGFTLSRIGNVKYVPSADLNAGMTISDAFFKKNDVWAYENEARLIHFDPNSKSDFKDLQLPPNCVKEIYFGLKCTDENKRKIIEALNGQSVQFYQIIPDSKNPLVLSSQLIRI